MKHITSSTLTDNDLMNIAIAIILLQKNLNRNNIPANLIFELINDILSTSFSVQSFHKALSLAVRDDKIHGISAYAGRYGGFGPCNSSWVKQLHDWIKGLSEKTTTWTFAENIIKQLPSCVGNTKKSNMVDLDKVWADNFQSTIKNGPTADIRNILKRINDITGMGYTIQEWITACKEFDNNNHRIQNLRKDLTVLVATKHPGKASLYEKAATKEFILLAKEYDWHFEPQPKLYLNGGNLSNDKPEATAKTLDGLLKCSSGKQFGVMFKADNHKGGGQDSQLAEMQQTIQNAGNTNKNEVGIIIVLAGKHEFHIPAFEKIAGYKLNRDVFVSRQTQLDIANIFERISNNEK